MEKLILCQFLVQISASNLFKSVTLSGSYWPLRIEKTASISTTSRIECASVCLSDPAACSFFVLKTDTLQCHLGRPDFTSGTVPTEAGPSPAFLTLSKLNQTIEDTTIRLHDVSEHSSWSKHIYQSQILTSDQADHMDCASQCLYVDSATCQIFAFDPADNSCHLGYFSKTDGSMTASVTSRHVYVAGVALAAQMLVKFDFTLDLPGSFWNDHILWITDMETDNFNDECAGFCYFRHPDPQPCAFAIVGADSKCYQGSFDATNDGSLINPAIPDTLSARIDSTLLNSFVASNYVTHSTSRWTPIIYEVVSSVGSVNECGLICFLRPTAECKFFNFVSTSCYLGDFSTTSSATSLTGTYTIYINYANVDGNNGNWMDRYQSTLQEASSTLLSRTVLTSSTDPVSVDDCAAFCHLASTDCSLYTFDPSGSVCYVGLLESSGGSYAGPAGPTIVTLDHARLETTLTNTYGPLDLDGPIWSTVVYQTITVDSGAFLERDCGAYCYLDNVQPCFGYTVDNLDCHLFDFNTAVAATSPPAKTTQINFVLLDSWREAFTNSILSHGARWRDFIYEIYAGAGNTNACAILCKLRTSTPDCHYFVLVDSNCYFGNFGESTIASAGTEHRTVFYREDDSFNYLTGAKDLFEDNTQFSSEVWPNHCFNYHTGVTDEKECAAKCYFYQDDRCHFYYHTGSTCYFGDFNSWGHTYLGATNAPIRFLPGSFDFRAQVAGKGDGCGGFYEITSTSFSLSISRPNYGNSDFCSWYIYNSVSTGQLKLYFPTFDTESCCDKVNLYSGPGTNGILLWTLSGSQNGATKYFNTPMVVITWSSDSSVTRTGFSGSLSWAP